MGNKRLVTHVQVLTEDADGLNGKGGDALGGSPVSKQLHGGDERACNDDRDIPVGIIEAPPRDIIGVGGDSMDTMGCRDGDDIIILS